MSGKTLQIESHHDSNILILYYYCYCTSTGSCKVAKLLIYSAKIMDFHLKMHSWKQIENLITFLPPPLPLLMLLPVTLNVITKSITALIREEGGKCLETIRVSQMTRNIASVSSFFAFACSMLTFKPACFFFFNWMSGYMDILHFYLIIMGWIHLQHVPVTLAHVKFSTQKNCCK